MARNLALGANRKALDDDSESIGKIRNALFRSAPERLPHGPKGRHRGLRAYIKGLPLDWQGPILKSATTLSFLSRGRAGWLGGPQPSP